MKSLSREIGSLKYRIALKFDIHPQQCCRRACQISERLDNSKYTSCSFEASRDLTIRRLIGYWNRARCCKPCLYSQSIRGNTWPKSTDISRKYLWRLPTPIYLSTWQCPSTLCLSDGEKNTVRKQWNPEHHVASKSSDLNVIGNRGGACLLVCFLMKMCDQGLVIHKAALIKSIQRAWASITIECIQPLLSISQCLDVWVPLLKWLPH